MRNKLFCFFNNNKQNCSSSIDNTGKTYLDQYEVFVFYLNLLLSPYIITFCKMIIYWLITKAFSIDHSIIVFYFYSLKKYLVCIVRYVLLLREKKKFIYSLKTWIKCVIWTLVLYLCCYLRLIFINYSFKTLFQFM